MASRLVYHITRTKDSGWRMTQEGTDETFDDDKFKYRLMRRATAHCNGLRRQGTPCQLIVHKADGTIQTEHTYLDDPERTVG